MHVRVLAFTARHSGAILLAAILLAVLVVGAAGEVAAHNPAGHPVPGCENGADTVPHRNPNCHG